MDEKEKMDGLLSRGVEEIIDRDDLKKKLESGRELRVKLGIDPTSPDIHIGRAVQLFKLKDFQDLGHKIIFIIGDFTGIIGDTSDKESERPMLAEEEIKTNIEKYTEQIGKIIDLKKCEIHYNSEWLANLNYREIAGQAEVFSLSDFIARENIKKRLEEGRRVSLREVLYPLMQGYDSVAVKADVEIGGTDQRFNLLAGRDLQRHYGQESQNIITNTLLEGLDGRKMSSSWGNTINMLDAPEEMFGKIMSLRDEFTEKYFICATRVSMNDIKTIKDPKELKTRLGKEIVKIYHGEKEAQRASLFWESTFSKREFPEDARVLEVGRGAKLIDALTEAKIIESKSEFRRLVQSGAVCFFPDQKITNPDQTVSSDQRLKIGKKIFISFKIK